MDSSSRSFILSLLFSFPLIFSSFLPLSSPSPHVNSNSILIALLDSQYTELAELVEKALLLQKLEESLTDHNITILAPRNHALERDLDPEFKSFLLQPCNLRSLQSILLFHVIPKRISAIDWPDLAVSIRTLAEEDLVVQNTVELGKTAESAPILDPDSITRPDGVIHGVDRLLVPQSVQEQFNSRRSLRSVEAVLPQGAPVTDLRNKKVRTPSSYIDLPISIYEAFAPVSSPVSAPAPAPGPGGSHIHFDGERKVNDFINSLILFGGYNEFVDVLVNLTSLGSEIGKLVTEGYSLTVLAPHDDAIAKMTTEQLSNPGGAEQMIYLHIIPEYQTEDSIYNAVRRFERVEYETLSQNQTITATELAGTVRFGGEEDGGNLFEPDIYIDGRISVQGIDGVLVPSQKVEKVQKVENVKAKSSRGSALIPTKGRRGKLMEMACWVIEALGQESKFETCQYQK